MYKFHPLIKHTLWGSESWVLSGVAGSETTVDGGSYDGTPLSQLVAREGERLMGRETCRRFGHELPLLVKFIDARRDLSIQVHPDDATAQRHGHPRGKSEMWYVLPSAPDASLYCGLNRQLTPADYCRSVADGTITDMLARYEVKAGDVFYIPAGRIHSIGAGLRVAEIQQPIDLTYRIYDYGRLGTDGRPRQLHTELAAESIDYTPVADCRTHYQPSPDRRVPLVSCPHFTTALYQVTQPLTLDYRQLDTFVVLIGVGGQCTVTPDDGQPSVTLAEGDALLVPATAATLRVDGSATLLETYVP